MKEQQIARGRPATYGQEILQRRRRLTTALVPLKGRRILDFGCGNGAQTLELAREGGTFVAVDIDLHDLETLAACLPENLRVLPVLYDGTRVPLSDGSMDMVVSYEVLEHVDNEDTALEEMRRVLKPGGDLLITVPNKWWLFETHGAALPLLPWNRVPFFSWLPRKVHRRFAHARIYTMREVTRLVASHGFTPVRTCYVRAPLDVLPEGRVRRLLRSVLFRQDTTQWPFLSTAILFHGRASG